MWGSTAFAAGVRVSPVVATPLDVEGARCRAFCGLPSWTRIDLGNTHALNSARFLVATGFPFGGVGAGHGLCVDLCVAAASCATLACTLVHFRGPCGLLVTRQSLLRVGV